jgi:site-specific recombinase XerD
MQAAQVTLRDLNAERAIELIAQSGLPTYLTNTKKYLIRKFIRYLTDCGHLPRIPVIPVDPERERLKQEYEEYLRVQRGLSPRTIDSCWRRADQFLTFRFQQLPFDLSQVTALDIAKYLQGLTFRCRPMRDKTASTHLRNFFLFQSRRIASNLALGIPRVAQRYGARLPRSFTPEQVERILAAAREDTHAGRRNYAMLLLLARLGLRAQEVVALRLDDIQWRTGEILIRGKGQLHDRVPLPQEVGAALAEYIRRDRVSESRAVFVRIRAPRTPFKDGQMVNLILQEALAKTGLKPPVPYVGSHLLRHSLATALVQRGASLDEIGELLRHRSRQSTLIYAKVDLESLRSLAHPWPTCGGDR